jgi:AcrR family transcriptional regulator
MPKVTEAHLEQRRRQILDAAVACFARRGFHQTTMADIAARAGVSDTLAYRYFGSKDEIIEAAVLQHGDTTVDEILGDPGEAEDVLSLFDMLLTADVRRFERREEVEATMGMYFQSWAEALRDDSIREQVVEHWHRHFEVVESLVERGQRTGQISAELDARAVAWVALATHYGLNLLGVLDPTVNLESSKEVGLAMIRGLANAGSESEDKRET